MKLLIVTDAWLPQTNGVVTTLSNVITELRGLGHQVDVIEPSLFHTLPLPGYSEIRVAPGPWRRMGELVRGLAPDAIHIATEGPLGVAARAWSVRRQIPFTTSLHTKFPEYLHDRTGLPLSVGYRFMRWFHRPAARVLVTTRHHRDELAAKGFSNLVVWGRGVDVERFRPLPRSVADRPRLLYVGRVASEKNIEAFLALGIDADKVVVGDGPERKALEARFPGAAWLGYRYGEALTREYARADAFVFPSRTDTFGLVMLEAMACGTPVAAYPVTGPLDVVSEGVNGALDTDLGEAVRRALAVSRTNCREFALRHSWRTVAERLARNAVAVTDSEQAA